VPLPRVIPALADLTQDIAGPLPVELLQSWAAGSQSPTDAERLLDGYRIEGTVVASDTSGLSRLTEERDLLDVLSLVSAPKQVVHALGVEVGGRPIGVWIADNTEMYYPSSVSAPLVVDAMAEAQARIASDLPIRIGLCVHRGAFYEVGGGLYGGDAEAVEFLAEDFAGPGEILVTQAVADVLASAGTGTTALSPRTDLKDVYPPGVFTVTAPRRMPDLRGTNTAYPHPYPAEFFALLGGLRQAESADLVRQRIYDTYLREQTVVFVSRVHERESTHTLQTLLDEFVSNALVETIVKVEMQAGEHVAGLGSGLAILTFDTPASALDFAQAVRSEFAKNGVPVKLGIDCGPVLLFANRTGPSGLAGDPVNTASKLSEDTGAEGKIRITSRAASQMTLPAGAEPFDITVSRIRLDGFAI
jgi:hypothetical protein